MAIPFLAVGSTVAAVREVSGPLISQTLSSFRNEIGYNDVAQSRAVLYNQNRSSTLALPSLLQAIPGNDTTVRFSVEQAIRYFHSLDWSLAWGDGQQLQQKWLRLLRHLSYNGVRSAYPGTDSTTREDFEWKRLIELSAHAAPLGSVIKDYYRSLALDPGRRPATEDDLKFTFERSQVSRQEDRDRFLRPFVAWSIADVVRLRWMGFINEEQEDLILKSIGCVHAEDRRLMDGLSKQFPAASQLLGWSQLNLWDEDFAAKYDLDAGLDRSPVATFFSKVQGVGRGEGPLREQPEGEADWIKLAYRAGRKMPNLSEAIQMQWRLRPSGEDDGMSVIAGSPEWTRDDTIELLEHSGYSRPVVDRLIGLSQQPLQVRMIQTILHEAMVNPEIAAEVQEHFGAGRDWVEATYLDHGHLPVISKMSALAMRARVQREIDAEKEANEKSIRSASRRAAEDLYRAGSVTREEFLVMVLDRFFGPQLARDLADIVDKEERAKLDTKEYGQKVSSLEKSFEVGRISRQEFIERSINGMVTRERAESRADRVVNDIDVAIANRQVKSIHESWMGGTLNADQVVAALRAVGIVDDRIQTYIVEWTWERTEKHRMLTTSEILSAVKAGLMATPVALLRLGNLGWNTADAMVELAMVEREMATSAARAESAAQAKAQRDMATAARTAERTRKSAAAGLAKAAKAARKRTFQQTIDYHARILSASEYARAAHNSNDAFAVAAKAGNEDKMQAALEAEIAAYEKHLIDQIKMVERAQELGYAAPEIDQSRDPGPLPGAGNRGKAGGAAARNADAAAATGGPDAEASAQ